MKKLSFIFLALFSVGSMTAFIGTGKQLPNKQPTNCQSCHSAHTLTASNILQDQAGHEGYRSGVNQYAFEIAVSEGNINQGWKPDSTFSSMGFALSVVDTTGNPTGLTYACSCTPVGETSTSGSYAESLGYIPFRLYQPAGQSHQGYGAKCYFAWNPTPGYKGDIVIHTHIVLADGDSSTLSDWSLIARDTILYERPLSIQVQHHQHPVKEQRPAPDLFNVLGQRGGRLYLEKGKLKFRVL